MKFILRINWLILLIWVIVVVFQLPLSSSSSHFIWVDLIIFFGLILVQPIFYFRIGKLYGFSLVMLYTLALLTGLRMMLTIDSVFSGLGVLSMLLEVILIFYFIGVRGYLRSAAGMQLMGVSANTPKNSVSSTSASSKSSH